MNIVQRLAAALKALCQQRGWNLSRLAEKTGVSKTMLGQIERDESNPTVATLRRVVAGLNMSFSASIIPDVSAASSVFDPQQQVMVVAPVFPWGPELRFGHFSIAFAPDMSDKSTPHEKGVIEHVVMISGALDFCLQGEWYLLQPGEERRFAGDEAHAYRSRDVQAVHFHSLVHCPKEEAAGEPATRRDD